MRDRDGKTYWVSSLSILKKESGQCFRKCFCFFFPLVSNISWYPFNLFPFFSSLAFSNFKPHKKPTRTPLGSPVFSFGRIILPNPYFIFLNSVSQYKRWVVSSLIFLLLLFKRNPVSTFHMVSYIEAFELNAKHTASTYWHCIF